MYCTILSTAPIILSTSGFPPGIWRNTMMPTEILSSNRSLLHRRLKFINSRPCHHGLLQLRLLLGSAPAISRYHLVNSSRSVTFKILPAMNCAYVGLCWSNNRDLFIISCQGSQPVTSKEPTARSQYTCTSQVNITYHRSVPIPVPTRKMIQLRVCVSF